MVDTAILLQVEELDIPQVGVAQPELLGEAVVLPLTLAFVAVYKAQAQLCRT